MWHKQNDPGDDLAEIWRGAQHRRTEDACSWFTQIFKKLSDARRRYDWVLLRSLTFQARSLLPSKDKIGGSQRGERIEGGRSGE